MDLKKETLRLLENRPRTMTLEHIAHKTGLKHSWLKAFSNQTSPEPSVVKVQKLYEFLSGKKLQA